MADRTPTLSIRQPWAWAICNAGKTIENRDWPGCKYRGLVFIHASLWGGRGERLSVAAQGEASAMLARASAAKSPVLAGLLTLNVLYGHRGGIVGRARIVGVVDAHFEETVVDAVRRPLTDTERAWWTGGFGLVLANAEPIEMVPCKGALGLFQVDDVVRERVMSAKAVR